VIDRDPEDVAQVLEIERAIVVRHPHSILGRWVRR
jgi:hypothetical protein